MSRFDQEEKRTASELSQLLKTEMNLDRSADTIRDWMVKGCRGIQLEHLRAGGVLMSSVDAVKRFFERLNQ